MVNDDLVSYRKDLKSDFGDAWDDLADVIANLKGEFDQSDRDMFRECTNSDSLPEGDNIAECLQAQAAEIGVAEEFRRELNKQEDLISSLRSTGRGLADDYSVSEATRDAADFTKVAELNRMCARGDYSEVESEVSDDAEAEAGGSIDSYQDCVTAASAEADLRADLKDAYDTAG
jgi:hypothetical protein